MITDSIVLQTLSAPCFNRCRHCLLSSDGRVTGAAWDRSAALARRFKSWLSLNRPEVRFDFGFGYSMEHPRLGEALDTLNELGSVMGRMLQMDGLKLRDRSGAEALLITCLEHGVKHLNFTFYGTREYHDAFAGRQGDFSSLLQLVRLAAELGFERSAGIMLTAESAPMIGALVPELREAGLTAERSVRLLVPHSEGRGGELEAIRTRRRDLDLLGENAALLNRSAFRTEGEWMRSELEDETKRLIIITLTPKNIAEYEQTDIGEIIASVEALDDAYYAALPGVKELKALYGDPEGDRLFGRRDLLDHWRKAHLARTGTEVYDVTDETRNGSRRY